ncbi:MAG: NAD(P)H-dependent oxidoreductase [Verrucomicrobiales bacterium]
MPKILLLHAHPAPRKSHANRHLLEAARQVDGVTVRELYELYPDFMIDVPAEQRLLEAHDVIVLLHPFYWYSAPALVKEWLDLVLQHGWAYGEGGHALRGKVLLQAVTCGGSVEVYCQAGRHGHTVRDFLLPFEQSACLCGLTYLAPFVVHGVGALQTRAGIAPYAREFTAALTALRDGTLDLAAGVAHPWLNKDLASLIRAQTASMS